MKQAVENVIASHVIRATAAWALIGVSLCSVLMYSYFVGASIFQAFDTKQLTIEASELSSRLNELEGKHISLGNTMTLSRARGLGFVETTKQHFISRKPLGQILSLGDEL